MVQRRQQLLNVSEVAQMLNVSKSGVWAKVKEAGFPQPFKLSAKQTRWAYSELAEFIESIMGTRPPTAH